MTLFDEQRDNSCRAYINLRNGADPRCEAGKRHCEDLWQTFAPFADEHFVAEFPVHLHERWFEMYLTVALLRAGFNVECPKPGPDIMLIIDGRRVWIEATCATGGMEGLPDTVPEPPRPEPGKGAAPYWVPRDQITLRIRNSLHTKQDVFRQYVAERVCPPGDALVIAINVHGIPHAWVDMHDYMVRSLYGVGDPVVTIDRDTLEVVGHGRQQLVSIPRARTGAPVGVRPFIDSSVSHISGVIGSPEDVVNRPDRLGEWLALYPNVTAEIPWQTGTVRLGDEWTATAHEGGDWELTKVSHSP